MEPAIPRRDRPWSGWAYAGLGGLLLAILAFGIEASVALRLSLCLLALAVLLWPGDRHRRFALAPAQRTMLVAALTLVVAVAGVKEDAMRLFGAGEVRVWNVFHYYLGAKYFPELGYTDLYLAALSADEEGSGYWSSARKVRDLESYQIVARDRALAGYDPAVAFTADRWRAFRHDVEALQPYRSADGWRNVFRDRGYNGTPLWTVLGRALGAAPAGRGWLVALSALDLLLLAGTLVLLWRTFGSERTLLVLLVFLVSPFNVFRLVGGFLQNDWLCALVAAVCCFRRRPALAGALAGYAVLTRGFPLLWVAAAGIPPALTWWRTRRPPRRYLRYLLGVALFALAGFTLSLANGRGLAAWPEFFHAISVHGQEHAIGDRRIGLEHAFGAALEGLEAEIPDRRRRELIDGRRLAYGLSAALLVALFVAAAVRRRAWEAQILGQVPVFALLVLSRYYHGPLALLPLVGRRPAARRRIAAGQLAVFGGYYACRLAEVNWHATYALTNVLLAAYLAFVLAALALPWSRLCRRRRAASSTASTMCW